MLINYGLDINDTTIGGACFKLIEYDDIINIKKLKRDINLNFDFYFETGLGPIHYAALYKYTDLVGYFCSIGIDKDKPTMKIFTNNKNLILMGTSPQDILKFE